MSSYYFIYYLTLFATLLLWGVVLVASIVALMRKRRGVVILQAIAALALLAVTFIDFVMLNPNFGLLRTSYDIRTFYQFLSLFGRVAGYATFGIAFLFDRLSRPTAERGFVPEVSPPPKRF